MPKKQKPKRIKKYQGKPKKGGSKPKEYVELTCKNMDESNMIKEYYKHLEGKYQPKTKNEEVFFNNWNELSYAKETKEFQNTEKFLDWFKFQTKQNLKVFAIDTNTLTEYEIREPQNKELPNGKFVLIMKCRDRTRANKSLFYWRFTNITGGKGSMPIYNSNNLAFNLETQIIEKEKIKIKKEQIIKEINKDKTETFRKKITKFLKSKTFEKAYIHSLEKTKEEILNIIK